MQISAAIQFRGLYDVKFKKEKRKKKQFPSRQHGKKEIGNRSSLQ